jgi:D-xylulose reductase
VIGAGTIGAMTTLAALAGGCSQVIISDVKQEKLDIAAGFGPVIPVNVSKEDLTTVVRRITGGWGVDRLFEASGNPDAIRDIFDYVCPAGRVVLIGMPVTPVAIDIVQAQTKEVGIETVFRYAHMYPRALALLGSGRINVKPLITDIYEFENSIAAFDYAKGMKPTSVKVQITLR